MTHKAPPPVAPAPAVNWAGPYVGVYGGAGFSHADQSYSVVSPFLALFPPVIPFLNNAGTAALNPRGAEFGGEAGYNFSLGAPYVLGVAGDFGWSGENGRRSVTGVIPAFGANFEITQRLQSDWRGSLRLRAGVAPIDNLLVYATGGVAFADFRYTNTFWDSANETEFATIKAVRVGLTAGAGAEWAFTPNWSLAGEYRFSRFGGLNVSGGVPMPDGSVAIANHSTGPIYDNSLRLAIRYRFN